MKTPALAVDVAGGPFVPTTLDRREPRGDDVQIDIAFTGICHSDLHRVQGDWDNGVFPMVPGHEISGVVGAVGEDVSAYRVGDRVGVGVMVDSCGTCEHCVGHQQQFCVDGVVETYNSRAYDGSLTYGGYSRSIVVREPFVHRIPDGIELSGAAPLLCAGITVYSPLRRWGPVAGRKVAVVGIGGLGHLAVRMAAAMGAEVTALSRGGEKRADARRLGAVDHLATEGPSGLGGSRNRFDLMLNTVSAPLDMDPYLAALRPGGVLVNIGAPGVPLSCDPFSLIAGNRAIAGSMIGGSAETKEMLRFCAENDISTEVEVVDAAEIEWAYRRVRDGDARYRLVIDATTIGT
ncbi:MULTISPECIES: NAD(P)-dependent alcohol dehydrogenase [Streptomyces]|uniref:alcohol dehydrogenase (NADP(+)) n=1 Tax=Streptomyces chartreusis NRRL 3882 TaxID=1079985 RepID=A0A2N9B3D3_STRCX|nr:MULTISPECIES: NAD(P)-dependent alcohol dehydrogenase [Streptomyces]MYS89708.1 alcohol dehydrogenase catalytic domain-containing protein [Streptomyces sp. SID5464]SOR77833.1 putative formaldehyde dehydrogenase AdhA [Streptomyces chartreusis NRRL 3882]